MSEPVVITTDDQVTVVHDPTPEHAVVTTTPVVNAVVTPGTGGLTLIPGPAGKPGGVIVPVAFSATGELIPRVGQHAYYNDTGYDLEIINIRAHVGQEPLGDPIIVDVNMDGTTLFTDQDARPRIASGDRNDTAIPAITTWPNGSYLTVDVDAVGSTYPGATLTVAITAILPPPGL